MPNLYSPPTLQPQAEEKNPLPEFTTPELKTTPTTPLSTQTVTQPSRPVPAPNSLRATDDFQSWWAIPAYNLELAPPQSKNLRLLACLSPEVAEELQGYISPTASFEEVYQALAFMMKPEESQQVMLERFHTRA